MLFSKTYWKMGLTGPVLFSVSFLGNNLKVETKPQKLTQSREMQQTLQSVSKRLIFVIIHACFL
jgi:hypothetical protein